MYPVDKDNFWRGQNILRTLNTLLQIIETPQHSSDLVLMALFKVRFPLLSAHFPFREQINIKKVTSSSSHSWVQCPNTERDNSTTLLQSRFYNYLSMFRLTFTSSFLNFFTVKLPKINKCIISDFPSAVFPNNSFSSSKQSFLIHIPYLLSMSAKTNILTTIKQTLPVEWRKTAIVPSQMSQYGLSSFLLPWYWVPWLSSAPEDWVGQSSVSCWSNTSQISQNNRCFIPVLAGSSSSDLQTTLTQSVNVLITALRLV